MRIGRLADFGEQRRSDRRQVMPTTAARQKRDRLVRQPLQIAHRRLSVTHPVSGKYLGDQRTIGFGIEHQLGFDRHLGELRLISSIGILEQAADRLLVEAAGDLDRLQQLFRVAAAIGSAIAEVPSGDRRVHLAHA